MAEYWGSAPTKSLRKLLSHKRVAGVQDERISKKESNVCAPGNQAKTARVRWWLR
jgi:hypothetical protein